MCSFRPSAPNPLLMARRTGMRSLNIRPLEELAPKPWDDIPFLKKWFQHMDYDELWQRGNWKERTKSPPCTGP